MINLWMNIDLYGPEGISKMAEHLDGERDVFADGKQAYAGKRRL